MAPSPESPLLERLSSPEAALARPSAVRPDGEPADDPAESATRQQAARAAGLLHAAGRWSELIEFYADLAEAEWGRGRYRRCLRLTLAARSVAERTGDRLQLLEITGILAMRHRLRGGYLVAERWNHAQLASVLDESTARAHAVAWRELATLRQLAGEYQQGRTYCDQALGICREFPDSHGITIIRVQALLERGLNERLSGRLDLAFATLAEARGLAEAKDDEINDLTHGLIAMRQARLYAMTGNPAAGLAAYRRAEERFAGVSADNLMITRISQIECLGTLGRTAEAVDLTDRLAEECERSGDDTRLGQVLLERAEIQYSAGDFEGAADAARRATRIYDDDDSLEALRWRRHLARSLLASGGDQREAATHLSAVLMAACRPDRHDLVRTWQALHDVLLMPDESVISSAVWFAAGRGALAGAELQRDLLSAPEARWGVHAEREEVYAAAIRVHEAVGDHEAIAQVMELGRADVLNRVLSDGPRSRNEPLTELPLLLPSADPDLLQGLFDLGSAVAAVLRGDDGAEDRVGILPLPGGLPPPEALDALGDVVVMVQLGHGRTGWWSATAVRERGGSWCTNVRPAPEALDGWIGRMAAGELVPRRGVARAAWRALGEFLLPAAEIWRGSPDHPRSIVICPDPRLWHLPYPALLRGDVALVDVAEVTLAPSLRTICLVHDRAHHGRAHHGRPARSRRSPAVSLLDTALPGHTTELTSLNAWPGAHLPVDDLAHVANVPGAALLYVSGHGTAPGDSTLGPSGIALDTLAVLPLPDLLLLTGCWSATATSRYGRDPLSLAVGGLLGGADTVVAGIGRIGEQATARITAELLRLVADGIPVRAALRLASRALRDQHPELGPYDWAGLCIMGTGDAIWT